MLTYLNKYAVAILALHEHDNRLFVVEAETEGKAIKKALIEFDENNAEWVENMSNDVESIVNDAAEGELIISNIIKLKI